MNKTKWTKLSLIAIAVLLAAVLAFTVVGDQVFADDGDDPEEPFAPDFGGFGRGRDRNPLRAGGEVMLASIAEQTGISVDELEAAIKDRVRLEDLLLDAGYTEEEVGEIMLTAHNAAIDQAVADGKLTEEQAEELKARFEERLAEGLPFLGGGFRGRMADGLKERFGDDWREEFRRRMNPDCDCTCPQDGDS